MLSLLRSFLRLEDVSLPAAAQRHVHRCVTAAPPRASVTQTRRSLLGSALGRAADGRGEIGRAVADAYDRCWCLALMGSSVPLESCRMQPCANDAHARCRILMLTASASSETRRIDRRPASRAPALPRRHCHRLAWSRSLLARARGRAVPSLLRPDTIISQACDQTSPPRRPP